MWCESYPIRMRRFLIVFMMLSCLLLRSAGAGRSVLHEEDNDMILERELRKLNKPYVKSFKDKYGVVFDCVDMYKQPALDHPLLKNHKLQIRPSWESTWTGPSTAGEGRIRVDPQESCPDGTVLIRRTLKQDLAKAVPLLRFRPQNDYSEASGQHFAQLLVDSVEGSKFQAAGAIIEVDAVAVPAGQISSAQILLLDDSFHSSMVNVIQAGWSVNPDLHGDSQTRFITYWTADNHINTGCMNVQCPGFVVVSQTISPGMVLPTGTAGISISKDGQTGNWQVFLNQQIVGYFPKEIINNMAGATEVQMGGITYAPPGQKSPPMGTGIAPVPGKITLASKFMQIGVQGADIAKNWVSKDVSDSAIYNVVRLPNTAVDGNSFQYGGPGGA